MDGIVIMLKDFISVCLINSCCILHVRLSPPCNHIEYHIIFNMQTYDVYAWRYWYPVLGTGKEECFTGMRITNTSFTGQRSSLRTQRRKHWDPKHEKQTLSKWIQLENSSDCFKKQIGALRTSQKELRWRRKGTSKQQAMNKKRNIYHCMPEPAA